MSAIANLLMSICMGSAQANVEQACSKTVDAGLKQSGYEQVLENNQKTIENSAIKTSKEDLGETGSEVAAGTIYLTKIALDKKIHLGLPNMGLCDNMITDIGTDSTVLKLEWRF